MRWKWQWDEGLLNRDPRKGTQKQRERANTNTNTPGPERANPERAREEKSGGRRTWNKTSGGGGRRKRLNQPNKAKTYAYLGCLVTFGLRQVAINPAGSWALADLEEVRRADFHCPVPQVIGVIDLRWIAEETVARKLIGNVELILVSACWPDAVFHRYFCDSPVSSMVTCIGAACLPSKGVLLWQSCWHRDCQQVFWFDEISLGLTSKVQVQAIGEGVAPSYVLDSGFVGRDIDRLFCCIDVGLRQLGITFHPWKTWRARSPLRSWWHRASEKVELTR